MSVAKWKQVALTVESKHCGLVSLTWMRTHTCLPARLLGSCRCQGQPHLNFFSAGCDDRGTGAQSTRDGKALKPPENKSLHSSRPWIWYRLFPVRRIGKQPLLLFFLTRNPCRQSLATDQPHPQTKFDTRTHRACQSSQYPPVHRPVTVSPACSHGFAAG